MNGEDNLIYDLNSATFSVVIIGISVDNLEGVLDQ